MMFRGTLRLGASAAAVRRVPRAQFLSTGPASSAPSAPSSGGSSLFQRLGAFFAGVGVSGSACAYLMQSELGEANDRFDKTLRALEARIERLESK
jgi:hypothetical protein